MPSFLLAARRAVLAAALLLLAAPLAHAQSTPTDGVDVHFPADLPWQSFDAAIASADSSGRKVLVSIYAPWCGFCRRQNTEVFPDEAVGAFMRENFELARLNGDDAQTTYRFRQYTLTGSQLSQGFGVTGFPTVIFLDPQGGYITRLPGYAEAPMFLSVLRYIATDSFQEMTFEDFTKGSE